MWNDRHVLFFFPLFFYSGTLSCCIEDPPTSFLTSAGEGCWKRAWTLRRNHSAFSLFWLSCSFFFLLRVVVGGFLSCFETMLYIPNKSFSLVALSLCCLSRCCCCCYELLWRWMISSPRLLVSPGTLRCGLRVRPAGHRRVHIYKMMWKKKETFSSCFVNVKPKSGFCRGMWYRL